MEDKTFELMEKLYIEVQDMRTEIKEIKENMATKEDLSLLENQLHAEIQEVHEEVKELRHDLSTMEILTTKNAFDIAKLKSVR